MCLVSNPPNDLDIIEVSKGLSVALKNDTEWERFGMYLLDTRDKKELTLIQQNEKGNSLMARCKSLLELWKSRTAEPKWEHVIQTLRKVDLNQLATELETSIIRLEQPNGTCTVHVDDHQTHDGQQSLEQGR